MKVKKLFSCYCRPLSGSVLVVGCDNGLFVWTVDPSSPVVRLVTNLFMSLSDVYFNNYTVRAMQLIGQSLASVY